MRGPLLDTNSEVNLARDLMGGDPEAFDRFVDIFRSKIFQYSLLMCGQREDAEEVAQDTLLKIFQNLGQLREPERVRGWVFRIAKNACLMKRRKSIFAPSHELSLDEMLPARDQDSGQRLQIADSGRLPDSEVFHSELKRVLDEAIAGLPEIYRAVVLLRDLEELSTAETAEILGVREEVVKTRLHRARLAIREKLQPYLDSAPHAETGPGPAALGTLGNAHGT
jgi:RNA polymerase sigma-70 factor, ECF subfamily